MENLTIKSETAQSYTIVGHGIVWGGSDLEGEHFEPDTDLWLDKLTPTPMVLFRHGQDEAIGKSVVGRVVKTVKDEIGLWIEAQIDKAHEYADAIRELIAEGVLGLSSAAPAHLTEVKDGKILSWPIVEFSLTPAPCEPRTIPVMQMKELGELSPTIKSLLPRILAVELAIEDGERIIRIRN